MFLLIIKILTYSFQKYFVIDELYYVISVCKML